ncbi:unnamed protein product [Jaminaea pallidilutea]
MPSHLPSAKIREKMAQEAAKDAHHSYCQPSSELLHALATTMNGVYRKKSAKDSPSAIQTSDICLTAGCNMASEFVFRAVADIGVNDGIVLPTPFYFNHSMQLLGLGVAPVPLPCAGPKYIPSPTNFEALLAKHAGDNRLPRIKALVLVTPNNPTGAIYSADLISQFAVICRRHGLALILDETYRDFLLPEEPDEQVSSPSTAQNSGQHMSSGSVQPHRLFEDALTEDEGAEPWQWRDVVIQLYSFSKSFAIPGHRLGAIISHPHLISHISNQAQNPANGAPSAAPLSESAVDVAPTVPSVEFGPLSKLLDNSIICVPRLDVQRAVAWGLTDTDEIQWRRENALTLRRRAQTLRSAFADQGMQELGWSIESVGGYYALVSHPFGPAQCGPKAAVSSFTVSKALALLVGLGTLPVDFFLPEKTAVAGSNQYGAHSIRLSLANIKDDAVLLEVPKRLAALSQLWAERGVGWGV